MTGRAGRTPQQVERDRDRSRAWHARQRELVALTKVGDRPGQASGRDPDAASGHLQVHPDGERLVELERRVAELEARDVAREAELIELRAYRQRDRDRSRRNALKRRPAHTTGTWAEVTGTRDQGTGTQTGAGTANVARASRAPASSGTNKSVNSVGGGVLRARSRPAPPTAGMLPNQDETAFDRLWADPRVLTAIRKRQLNLEWERANFERKQGDNPRNWTVPYLVAWLLRSTVQVPDPKPISRVVTDRKPRQDQPFTAAACATSAYVHDPWAGRRPPIAEADLARAGVL